MLTRVATVGLILEIVFGALLFITRATEYTASSLFITKMVAVGTGILNALAIRIRLETPTIGDSQFVCIGAAFRCSSGWRP